MKGSEEENQYKKRRSEVITFTVPNVLETSNERKNNVNQSTSKLSKEKIIDKALRYHLEGNIQESIKYYKYCIDNNFNDPKVFMNYGIILKDLGQLEEAIKFTRKAIELKPDYAEAYTNLGSIFKTIGKLNEDSLL